MSQNPNIEPTNVQPGQLPVTFPENHVVGVIYDMEEARMAVQDLQAAGYDANEIRLVTAEQFIKDVETAREEMNAFQQFLHRLVTTSDQGFTGDIYLAAAQRGGNILTIYASNGDEAGYINSILADHGASLVKYMGTWSITNFPPGKAPS